MRHELLFVWPLLTIAAKKGIDNKAWWVSLLLSILELSQLNFLGTSHKLILSLLIAGVVSFQIIFGDVLVQVVSMILFPQVPLIFSGPDICLVVSVLLVIKRWVWLVSCASNVVLSIHAELRFCLFLNRQNNWFWVEDALAYGLWRLTGCSDEAYLVHLSHSLDVLA